MTGRKLDTPDLLEEYAYQLAGGPLPKWRQRAAQRQSCLGCLFIVGVVLFIAFIIILMVKVLL